MSPLIALIVCVIFVRFLLRIERKSIPDVTPALWVPTIWILYSASKPLAVWFPWSGSTPESSPLDRAFLVALLIAALWILVGRSFDWAGAAKQNGAAIVLLAYMLVSIFWSAIPGTSFVRWVREVQAAVMAFLVLSEPSPRRAMESILRRTTFILIPFSLLLAKYFPQYGVEYGRWSGSQMWIGVTQQKNGLGRLCLIAGFFLIWSLVRRRQGKNVAVGKYQTYAELILLGMTFWLMRGPGGDSFSATAAYALGAGLIAYWAFSWASKHKFKLNPGVLLFFLGAIMVFGVVSLFVSGSNIGFFASSAGRNATLTGRTEVWAQLLPVAMRKPILGYGFGAFWTPAARMAYVISEGHSGYLDVLLELGFAGLFLVAVFVLNAFGKARRELERDNDWSVLCMCFILMAVIHNIAETSFDSFTNHLTAIILFLTVSSVKLRAIAKPSS